MDNEQRRRICRLIAGLVVADSELAPEEDAFVDRMLQGFGIPLEERDSIFPILDDKEAAAEIRSLPPEVQQQALTLLVQAAAVDGHVVDEERSYIHAVGNAIGVGKDDLDRRMSEALRARTAG